MLKVLIADDHPLMLVALRHTLEEDGGFTIIGEANCGTQVLPLVGRTTPDVVVLDLRMPGVDGIVCLDRIVSRFPHVKVVIFSACTDVDMIQASFKHGACGYIVKSINVHDLPSAIRQAVEKTAYHAYGLPALNDKNTAKEVGLTDRELAILILVAAGLPNQDIGKKLFVTEQTIKFHLTNVFRKLNVSNRTEAARWAHSRGLVSDTDHKEVAIKI